MRINTLWPSMKLGDAFEILTGNTPSTIEKKYYGNDVLFAKPPDLNNSLITSTGNFLSFEGANAARTVPAGSVLVSCIGILGKTGLLKNEGSFNQQINAIKPNNRAIPKFLFYQAQSPYFQRQLSELASATTVAIVNKSKFSSIEILLPAIDIQTRVVAKLDALFSDLDKSVACLKKAQEQLKVYRQAVLKAAFEADSSPKEENVELSEGCEIQRGKSKHRPRDDERLYGGIYPFIQTGDVRAANGGIIEKYTQTYSEFGIRQSKLWPKGTLCITIAANIADTGFLGFEACFPDSVVGLLPKSDRLRIEYLNYYIIANKDHLERLAPATAQKNINVN